MAGDKGLRKRAKKVVTELERKGKRKRVQTADEQIDKFIAGGSRLGSRLKKKKKP